MVEIDSQASLDARQAFSSLVEIMVFPIHLVFLPSPAGHYRSSPCSTLFFCLPQWCLGLSLIEFLLVAQVKQRVLGTRHFTHHVR